MNMSFEDQDNANNDTAEHKNLTTMINLMQAKSIAEEEEFGYLDSKYDLISQSNNEGNTALAITLNSA
jgi:hypothetical protein